MLTWQSYVVNLVDYSLIWLFHQNLWKIELISTYCFYTNTISPESKLFTLWVDPISERNRCIEKQKRSKQTKKKNTKQTQKSNKQTDLPDQ